MKNQFSKDLLTIREILDLSQNELADQLGVENETIIRNEQGIGKPSKKLMEEVYTFAFQNNIQLNRLKEMFGRENLKEDHILLFHGSKSGIKGSLSNKVGRKNNDFGQGFYTGEKYEQAISFVSTYDEASVYLFDFDTSHLKRKKYKVDREWMLTIAYYRGALDEYKEDSMVKNLVKKSRNCDYIVAPIADNRMFQIINSFIRGEITDEQCKHCLAATNLGNQYILISDEAIQQLNEIECCYICKDEKNYYKEIRVNDTKLGADKVKMARIKYRGQGKYIDEILKGNELKV